MRLTHKDRHGCGEPVKLCKGLGQLKCDCTPFNEAAKEELVGLHFFATLVKTPSPIDYFERERLLVFGAKKGVSNENINHG